MSTCRNMPNSCPTQGEWQTFYCHLNTDSPLQILHVRLCKQPPLHFPRLLKRGAVTLVRCSVIPSLIDLHFLFFFVLLCFSVFGHILLPFLSFFLSWDWSLSEKSWQCQDCRLGRTVCTGQQSNHLLQLMVSEQDAIRTHKMSQVRCDLFGATLRIEHLAIIQLQHCPSN